MVISVSRDGKDDRLSVPTQAGAAVIAMDSRLRGYNPLSVAKTLLNLTGPKRRPPRD